MYSLIPFLKRIKIFCESSLNACFQEKGPLNLGNLRAKQHCQHIFEHSRTTVNLYEEKPPRLQDWVEAEKKYVAQLRREGYGSSNLRIQWGEETIRVLSQNDSAEVKAWISTAKENINRHRGVTFYTFTSQTIEDFTQLYEEIDNGLRPREEKLDRRGINMKNLNRAIEDCLFEFPNEVQTGPPLKENRKNKPLRLDKLIRTLCQDQKL